MVTPIAYGAELSTGLPVVSFWFVFGFVSCFLFSAPLSLEARFSIGLRAVVFGL